jgi:hypothetical protein
VPFARAGWYFSRDFEDLGGWLATAMDKTAVCRLVRIDWDTVGRIITRVMAEGLDPDQLEELFDIRVLKQTSGLADPSDSLTKGDGSDAALSGLPEVLHVTVVCWSGPVMMVEPSGLPVVDGLDVIAIRVVYVCRVIARRVLLTDARRRPLGPASL